MGEKRVLYFALGVLAVVAVGQAMAVRNDGLEFPDGSIQVTAAVAQAKTKVYLTDALHTGSTALSACATGWHMASQWEIPDPLVLEYDNDAIGAYTGVTEVAAE